MKGYCSLCGAPTLDRECPTCHVVYCSKCGGSDGGQCSTCVQSEGA